MTISPKIDQLVKSLSLPTREEAQLLEVDSHILEQVVPLLYRLTKNRPDQSPTLLFELCATSNCSLSEWCECILALYNELQATVHSAHLNSALHYIHCCAQVSQLNSLKTTAVEYLRLYGMQDAFSVE